MVLSFVDNSDIKKIMVDVHVNKAMYKFHKFVNYVILVVKLAKVSSY